MNLRAKDYKNKYEIVQLLEAIWLLTELVIIQWLGHQKDKIPQTQGKNHADQVAKGATCRTKLQPVL